uniref:Serine aminopeptidase S33 domain-containing protein n=1 Tax=viral metagenome TaxID=1070528 RepID=A0A6C0J3K6_9ZZZZ
MNNFSILNDNNRLNILTDNLDNPKIILIHLHGLHGHFQHIYDCADDFTNRTEILKKANIKSYALEFRGHGKSSGKVGYFKNFDELMSDFERLLEYIKHLHPNIPTYLLGESMGGGMSVKIAILFEQISGIILLAPMLGVANKIKPKDYLINFLLKIATRFPNVKLINKTKYKKYKYKDYNIKYIESEYTIKNKLTLGILKECHLLCKWIDDNKMNFNKSLLIIHSKLDDITCVEKSKNFYEKCSSPDKEILLVDNSEHCLLVPNSKIDCMPQTLMLKIVNWLNKKL